MINLLGFMVEVWWFYGR